MQRMHAQYESVQYESAQLVIGGDICSAPQAAANILIHPDCGNRGSWLDGYSKLHSIQITSDPQEGKLGPNNDPYARRDTGRKP